MLRALFWSCLIAVMGLTPAEGGGRRCCCCPASGAATKKPAAGAEAAKPAPEAKVSPPGVGGGGAAPPADGAAGADGEIEKLKKRQDTLEAEVQELKSGHSSIKPESALGLLGAMLAEREARELTQNKHRILGELLRDLLSGSGPSDPDRPIEPTPLHDSEIPQREDDLLTQIAAEVRAMRGELESLRGEVDSLKSARESDSQGGDANQSGGTAQ